MPLLFVLYTAFYRGSQPIRFTDTVSVIRYLFFYLHILFSMPNFIMALSQSDLLTQFNIFELFLTSACASTLRPVGFSALVEIRLHTENTIRVKFDGTKYCLVLHQVVPEVKTTKITSIIQPIFLLSKFLIIRPHIYSPNCN